MALIQCKNCGNSISNKAIICPKCGTRLVETEPISQKKEVNSSIRRIKNIILAKKKLAVALLPVLLVISVGIIVNSYNTIGKWTVVDWGLYGDTIFHENPSSYLKIKKPNRVFIHIEEDGTMVYDFTGTIEPHLQLKDGDSIYVIKSDNEELYLSVSDDEEMIFIYSKSEKDGKYFAAGFQ